MQRPSPAHGTSGRRTLFVVALLLTHVTLGNAGCADDSVSGDADFALVAPAEIINLQRGTLVSIEFRIERRGGFSRSVLVTASMLVAGVTPGAATVRNGDSTGTLQLAVESSAPLGPVDGAMLVGVANPSSGETEALERTTPLALMVTEAVP